MGWMKKWSKNSGWIEIDNPYFQLMDNSSSPEKFQRLEFQWFILEINIHTKLSHPNHRFYSQEPKSNLLLQ